MRHLGNLLFFFFLVCAAKAFAALRHVVTFSRVGAKRVRGACLCQGTRQEGKSGGGVKGPQV